MAMAQQTRNQATTYSEQQVEQSPEFHRLVSKNLTGVEYTPFGQEKPIKLDFYQIKRLVSARTKSGAVADDDEIWRFMKRCEALRANPYTNDIYLIGYDSKDGPKFSAVTSISYMLKRAEVNPNFRGIVSGVIVADASGKLTEREGDFVANGENLAGAWCKVYRGDRDHPFYNCIRRDVYAKSSPLWQAMEAHMVVKCCRADVLRTAFPSELSGMYADEEFQMLLHTPKATPNEKKEARQTLADLMQKPLAATVSEPEQQPEPPATWNEAEFNAALEAAKTADEVLAVGDKYEPLAGAEAGKVAFACNQKLEAMKGVRDG